MKEFNDWSDAWHSKLIEERWRTSTVFDKYCFLRDRGHWMRCFECLKFVLKYFWSVWIWAEGHKRWPPWFSKAQPEAINFLHLHEQIIWSLYYNVLLLLLFYFFKIVQSLSQCLAINEILRTTMSRFVVVCTQRNSCLIIFLNKTAPDLPQYFNLHLTHSS